MRPHVRERELQPAKHACNERVRLRRCATPPTPRFDTLDPFFGVGDPVGVGRRPRRTSGAIAMAIAGWLRLAQ
jgi:hypothetical protein